MTFDNSLLTAIKDRLDLRELVEQALGPGKPSGESRRWGCPFHQGRNPTAFAVFKDRFYCWSCEAKGDVITWLMRTEQLDFQAAVKQAAALAGLALVETASHPSIRPRASVYSGCDPYSPAPRRPICPLRPPLQPPDPDWQQSNHYYVKKCQAYLWSQANRPALDYLRGRGLRDSTIQRAYLGYDPGRQAIIMPWYIEGELWRLGAKSLRDAGKAPLFAGFKQGLYNADRLTAERPALLLEGEFDALIVEQEAGDLVTPVATGGVTLGRQVRWVAALARLPHVFVAFDADPPGERAAAWWLAALSHNARRCRPVGAKDPNDMLKAGLDLRQWLAGLPGTEAQGSRGAEGQGSGSYPE